MLAATLMPTLSHALASAHPEIPPNQVCTAQGMRVVEPGGNASNGSKVPLGVAHVLDDCAWCAQSSSSFGPLPTGSSASALISMFRPTVAVPRPTPRALVIWRNAQPRGPPTLS
jgi:hypothetical protein